MANGGTAASREGRARGKPSKPGVIKTVPVKREGTTKAPRAATDDAAVTQRLSFEKRREHILAEAIQYFSEVGFAGSTRELATRIGVKQPLLYRYFPSKEDLVREVYDAVYFGRWRHDWDTLLKDRSIPLRDRLIDFYSAYAEIMFQPEWIRIFFFSGLQGLDINKRYISFMEDRVLSRICEEVRHSYDLPSVSEIPVHPEELAAFWIFHGGIFYFGVRREVFNVPVHVDLPTFVRLSVDGMVAGFPALARQILENARPAKPRASRRRPRAVRETP